MRILDEIGDKSLEYVLIMLTMSEARQFLSALKQLVPEEEDFDPMNHIHVSDDDLSRQITMGIYAPDDLRHFSDRVQRLIEED